MFHYGLAIRTESYKIDKIQIQDMWPNWLLALQLVSVKYV